MELPKFEKYILPSLIGKPYSEDEPKLHYWLWAMLKAHREEMAVKEVVEMETALKDFAAVDAGFAQYTERNEDINRDDKIKLQYAMWTEGMAPLEQAHFEGVAEGEARGEAKGRNDIIDELLKFRASPELLEQALAKLAETRTNRK